MTPEQLLALGTAFAAYLRLFAGCFSQERTVEHLHAYCRGLLRDIRARDRRPSGVQLQGGQVVVLEDDRPGRKIRRPKLKPKRGTEPRNRVGKFCCQTRLPFWVSRQRNAPFPPVT